MHGVRLPLPFIYFIDGCEMTSRQLNNTSTRAIDYNLMTVGLESINAGMIIWFTWHFHILSKYYSLLATQFQLSQLRLKLILVLWWGRKSELWNDGCWQTTYPLKISALPLSAYDNAHFEKKTSAVVWFDFDFFSFWIYFKGQVQG